MARKKKPYYAFNFGGWHFISLDSQCDPKHPEEGTVPGGGCKKNSAQEKWLLKNLKSFREKNKNDPKKCILAYFHEPLFSSANGSRTAPYKDRPVYPLWKDLYNYRTAIVLNGHYHDYERFTPLNQNGQARKNGVREFVVATGGSDPWFGFRENPKISKKQIHHEPGVLELTLKPHSYTWHFYHTEGAQGDSGKGTCPTYKKQ